ncbi:peroxidasin-like [Oculina patagonica]
MFYMKLSLAMLLFGFVLVICPGLFFCNPCVTSDQVIHNPKAPSLEVRTLSDYNNAFLVGHNFSVVCTSNSSKEYEFEREDAQPNWIGMFYDTGIQKACSLKGDLREDTMTCTMVISNATIESSGNYSCMAQNEMMCTIITTLVVVEEPSPPKITIYPMERKMMVPSGSYFNLSCEASGVPPPKITWFKDGSQIMSNSSIEDVRGSSVMTIMSVRPENRGHYWCEANNTEGWVQSSAVVLKVLWKPYFVSHPENVSIYEDENVTLSCSAAGFPTPVIGWLKDNMSIRGFSSVGGNSSLHLHFVKREIANGKYSCAARNSLGKTFSLEGIVTVLSRQKTRENIKDKTATFNPVWIWLGVVVAILLLSTALVFVRKFWRARHHNVHNSYVSQSEEVVTGYTRF